MEMVRRAESIGANAVVGVDVDYEVLGQRQYADGHGLRHGSGTRITTYTKKEE